MSMGRSAILFYTSLAMLSLGGVAIDCGLIATAVGLGIGAFLSLCGAVQNEVETRSG